MANTLAHQDEVQQRSEVMNRPNACPMKNKDERVEMPQRKVQQPQLNRLSPHDQAQLEFNDPGLHSPMASPSIFVHLQRRVVEQLPFFISASVHQQLRQSQDYFCCQCVINGPEVGVTSTDARLLTKKEMRAEPLDRHYEHQCLRSILGAKLGTRDLRTMKC